jgi:lipopolysaccharide/colanic/teichoic acid biosynthesis glycosyltransferase
MRFANPEYGEAATMSPGESRTIRGSYQSIKPKLEFAMALVLLVLSAPVIFLAMVLVKLGSRGPWIYCQKRLGLDGKIFTIYKIRTMYQDSERDCGPTWCTPGDPRVTPIGRLLRACHLDELPQLFNVLKGEMSLVGPRPERPEFLEPLERDLPGYRRRLAVRPGLTGLAQVQQPPDTDVFSVRRKLSYDLYYVEQMNPWLDFRLILGTALKCLGVPFVWIGWILQLPDPSDRNGRGPLRPEPELTASSLAPDSYIG